MGRGRIVRRADGVVWTCDGSHASDDELVAAARRGEPEAFTVLYNRYKLDVWQLAWFTLRDHHEAEDALQETFLKAHRALGRRHGTGPLRPWLLTICRNACRDRLRGGLRRATVPLDEELAIAAPAADREQRLDFVVALERLDEDEREAFLLVDVLGCHSDEAARITGLAAASTLRSRLARARRALAAAAEPAPVTPAGRDVWGLLHSAQHSVIVVASPGGEPGTGAGVLRAADGSGLLPFLERMDRRIPPSHHVLAVVEDRPPGPASVAAPWLAGHPRWQLQRSPTHATWLDEVEDLLSGWPTGTTEAREAVRARLAAGIPFTWTCET